MKSPLASLFGCASRRAKKGNMVAPPHFLARDNGATNACRSERVRARLAALALSGLLIGQTLVPCGMLISSVGAAELRVAEQAKVKSPTPTIPAWARDLEQRAAKQQRAQKARLAQFARPGQSEPGEAAADFDCLDCEVDAQPLDLSDVPTEKALRRAGGVEGALYPMRRAEPRELGIKLDRLLKRVGVEGGLRGQLPPKDPRFAALQRAQQRYARAQAINTLFGRAVKQWQAGERTEATALFAQYMNQYPKTPWSGEALLHLGYDAKNGGRLAEASEIFATIEDKTSEKPNKALRAKKRDRKTRGVEVTEAERETDVDRALEGAATLEEAVGNLDSSLASDDDDESFEIHMKAKQQRADLDLLMGHYNAAQQTLSEIVRDDTNWRRRTWASSEWQRASFLAQDATQMVACGPQALGLVLVGHNKVAAADRVRRAKAPHAQGFSLAELKTLAHQNGVEMRGFAVTTRDLARLPLPAILHYDFGPDAPAKGKAAHGANNGHFVTLQGVDAKSQTVRLFDPLQQKSLRLSYAQLQRQWSGEGLALKNNRAHLVGAPLSVRAMQSALGGQTSNSNRNVGADENNSVSMGGSSDYGSPVVEINNFSMNMYVHDTPLWYQPSRGPAVEFTLSYNSQDSASYYQNSGNKWMMSYGSYVRPFYDAKGEGMAVIMPDASIHTYRIDPTYPNYNGGYGYKDYISEPGDYTHLIQDSGANFILVFQDGSRWKYGKYYNGDVMLITSISDAWNNSLDLNYEGNQLKSIVDADGRSTVVDYDFNGKVKKVTDPFGRFATFSYSNGELVQAVDMEGQVFNYSYSGAVISRVDTPHGSWLYAQDGPYPVTNDKPADASIYVTATNPLLDKTYYQYQARGSADPFINIDYKGQKTSYSFVSGANKALKARTVFPNSETVSSGFNSQNLVNALYDERGLVTGINYNNQGQITGVSKPHDPASKIFDVVSFQYASNAYVSNGLDKIGATNENGVQTVSATYDAQRSSNAKYQPLTVTDLSNNGTTQFSYTAWGDPEMTIDPQNRGTLYVYGTVGSNLRRLIEIKSSDAPATANGPRNWVKVAGFSYDAAGRVTTATDAANLMMSYEYDLADRVTAVIYPDNTREETTYLNGLAIKFRDRSGRLSFTEYDALQRVKKTWAQDAQNGNAQVGTTQMDYDKNGNLILLTDTKGNQTRWSYDKRDRADSKTYQDGKSESYLYTKARLTQVTGTRGQVIKFAYDNNGNQTLIDYPNTPDVTTTYNKLDDVTRITDSIGTHVLNYDNYGRLLSNDGPLAADTQTYTYDELQRIQTQTVEQGANGGMHSQTYAYDALGRLASLNASSTGLTTYSYDGNTDRLRLLTHPNGTKSDLRYDSIGRLQHVFNGANGDALYNRYSSNYDARDVKINTQSRTGSSNPFTTTQYTYDALDQLKQERVTGGVAGTPYTHDYNYDAMGNRTQVNRASANVNSSTTSTPNALNQLTNITTAIAGGPTTSANLTYDAAGNLTQTLNNDGTRTIYSYDDADRLNRIEQRNASNVAFLVSEFAYDYASRRAWTREHAYNGAKWVLTEDKRRVFDGMDVIQERNSSNYITAQLVRDGNISGILSRLTVNGPAFYGYDGNGNVTLLTDAAGQDVAHYRYDAFGQTLEAAGPRAGENPYRFSTKEQHGPTGLYDYGLRFYSPGMGRWLNRDPLEEEGGINLYAAMGNNPVNSVDEYGLSDCPATGAAATGGCAPKSPKPEVTVLINPFTGKNDYVPHDSTGKGLIKPSTVDVMKNIAASQSQISGNIFWFFNQVRGKGPWDFKQINPSYEDFGNFHYGIVGRAMGISRTRLLSEAGAAQVRSGTSKSGWGTPNNIVGRGGVPPYGDDPKDQLMIKRGMNWYDAYAKAKTRNMDARTAAWKRSGRR